MSILLIVIFVILLLVMFLYAVFPATRRHCGREVLRSGYIAHRGLHNKSTGIPENSLPAFEAAAEEGYIIENDIHLTRDGEVVVFHDHTLQRLCGVEGKIEDKTLAELKVLRLLDTDCKIPTLKECLDTVGGRVPLLVEFKVDGNTEELCRAADKILAEYDGMYFVQSFFPQAMLWYRKNRKNIMRGQLATKFADGSMQKRLLGCLMFNFISRPDFVAYEHKYADFFIRRLVTRLGALPVCWTLRSQKALDAAKKEFCTYIFENFKPQ